MHGFIICVLRFTHEKDEKYIYRQASCTLKQKPLKWKVHVSHFSYVKKAIYPIRSWVSCFFVSEQYPGDPWTFNLHWQIILLFKPFRKLQKSALRAVKFLTKDD